MKKYDFEDLTIYFKGEIYKYEEYASNNSAEIHSFCFSIIRKASFLLNGFKLVLIT